MRPWQTISVDIMGPYPETRRGNRYLVVATDLFSKWVEAEAVPRTRAKDIINFLENLFQRWGYPEELITDNGTSFRGAMWEHYHQRNSIRLYTCPIYHQRSNPVERRNQELKKLLRVHLRSKSQNKWDQVIGQVLFTLRNRTNAATGITPSEALLGAQLTRPGEWQHPRINREVNNQQVDRERRIDRVRARHSEYLRQFFPEPRTAPQHFNVDDQVLVRTFAGVQTAFGAPWSAPYTIISVRGDSTYEVDRNGSRVLVHVDDLRPAPKAPLDEVLENDPFTRQPGRHQEEAEESAETPGESQPGPSFRPLNPADFVVPPRTTVSLCTRQVTIQDWGDDPGDPDEAQPVPGLIPVMGLYP